MHPYLSKIICSTDFGIVVVLGIIALVIWLIVGSSTRIQDSDGDNSSYDKYSKCRNGISIDISINLKQPSTPGLSDDSSKSIHEHQDNNGDEGQQ